MLDRGEQVGWFESDEIVLEAAVGGRRLLLLPRPLSHDAGPVHPHPRSSGTGISRSACIFMFIVGIILLATMALITPYIQNVMGYPVMDAGLLLGTRGIGTLVSMMLVGRLLRWSIRAADLHRPVSVHMVACADRSVSRPNTSAQHI